MTHMVPDVVGTIGMSSASVGMDQGIWNWGASSRITMFLKSHEEKFNQHMWTTNQPKQIKTKTKENDPVDEDRRKNKHGTQGSWHSRHSTSSSSSRSWNRWHHTHRSVHWLGGDRSHKQFAAVRREDDTFLSRMLRLQFYRQCSFTMKKPDFIETMPLLTLNARQTLRATSFSMAESMTG